MNHKKINELIKRKKEERNKFEVSSYDIARIHAYVSLNGKDCEKCHKKIVEAGIIKDFNKDIEK